MLYAVPTACPQFYMDGEAPDVANEKLANKTRELCFEAFGVMHSGISKTPLWRVQIKICTKADTDSLIGLNFSFPSPAGALSA